MVIEISGLKVPAVHVLDVPPTAGYAGIHVIVNIAPSAMSPTGSSAPFDGPVIVLQGVPMTKTIFIR